MRKRATHRRDAFTLIELLVVVSIIAILISILVPSLAKARVQAKRSVTLAHLHGLGTAVTVYANENRDRFPALFDQEEKAFLGLSLLGKQHGFNERFFINPNTRDSPPSRKTTDGRLILADLNGVEITNETPITPGNIGQVQWHCSYAYDNDVKNDGFGRARVYLGDRADYENGRTFSANWSGEGMCLLWTDQHAEFHTKRSMPLQSDPNIYHHNEFGGEGSDEVVDGVRVRQETVDTHLRFFSEEEDDVLLPD